MPLGVRKRPRIGLLGPEAMQPRPTKAEEDLDKKGVLGLIAEIAKKDAARGEQMRQIFGASGMLDTYPGDPLREQMGAQTMSAPGDVGTKVARAVGLAGLSDPQALFGGLLNPTGGAAGPGVMGAGVATKARQAANLEKKLGQGKTLAPGEHLFQGTVPKEKLSRLRDRQRVAFPGVYGNPKELAAAANVAPENPLLQQLWGVNRRDMSDIALSRQGNLPEWMPENTKRPGAVNAAGYRIMTPSNRQRIVDILGEARARPDLAEGMQGWYVMDPMYQRMEQLMGPEEAAKRYLHDQTLMALSSPGADVLTEANRGSRAAWMSNQGRFDEFLAHGGNPNELIFPPGANRGRLPFEYDDEMAGLLGHAYHSTSQAKPMKNYLETGSLGGAAKVPAYVMAGRPPQLGFQSHYPVGDAHWARGVGLSDVRTSSSYPQSATLTEMQGLAPWYYDIAQDVGLEAVPAQALQWGTLGPQTGVQTAIGQPKLELITEAIQKAAARTGQSPETVRDLYLMGKQPIGNADIGLLGGMAGAGGLGALGYGYFGSE